MSLIEPQLYNKILEVFPVVCVDIVVRNTDQEILLLKRENDPAKGEWWFPGGRVMRDETRLDAAKRILLAECNITTNPGNFNEIGTFDVIMKEKHGVTTVFKMEANSNDIVLDDQSSNHIWVNVANCGEMKLHPFLQNCLNQIRSLEEVESSMYKVISTPNDELTLQFAEMHVSYLSYRSFITNFGVRFLNRLYKDILSTDKGFIVYAEENSKITGFVLCVWDSEQIFKLVKRRFYNYLPYIIKGIFNKPSVLVNLLQTLAYPKKEGVSIRPELVVIVTDINNRSKGVGSKLIKALESNFIEKRIDEYKVTVHSEMEKSNNFYIRNGFTIRNQFVLYGVQWNLYTKTIDK